MWGGLSAAWWLGLHGTAGHVHMAALGASGIFSQVVSRGFTTCGRT